MKKEKLFIFSADFNLDEFVNDLTTRYRVKKERPFKESYVYSDTFDWRLYHQSLLLFRTDNTLFLQSLHDNTILERAVITSPPLFVSDLPGGRLREAIAPIIEMRALRNLFTLQARCTRMRVMNADAKTVLRLDYEVNTLPEASDTSPFATCFRLKPLRGYDKHARRLARWLRSKGGAVSQDSRYFRGLAAVNQQPGDYTSKLRVSLQPTMRADAATKIILRALLQVIKRNEAGVINDTDTEFLHDYRVAIRRTRSALGQIKAVFPADVTARFRTYFADLGKTTNRLRDLDVYLLHKADYKALLPISVRPDIEPLFASIQRDRAQALRSVARKLQSPTYADLLQRWESFLEQPPLDTASAPNAARPIRDVARQRIRRKCRRVITLGHQLLAAADEQALHALRIECKKLRYLLEFFFSLFPARQVTTQINQLRTLQDNLGRYNDLRVQQETLRDFSIRMTTSDAQRQRTLDAIERLVGVLETEKQRAGQAFPDLFTAFAGHVTREGML